MKQICDCCGKRIYAKTAAYVIITDQKLYEVCSDECLNRTLAEQNLIAVPEKSCWNNSLALPITAMTLSVISLILAILRWKLGW
jgi:ribosomal protein L24E